MATLIPYEFNMQKITRISDELFKFIKKKTKDPYEAYIVLKGLIFFLESNLNAKLDPRTEEHIRKIYTRK